MENTAKLPQGYQKDFVLHPLKNPRQEWVVWGVDLLLALILYAVAQVIWEGQALLLFTHRIGFYGTWLVLIGGFLIYAVLHEVVRAVCIRLVTGDSAQHYDHTLPGVYMNTGSRVFLNRGSFAVIALVPVVLLGAVLVALNLLGGFAWFWPIYLIQWLNLSEAVPDCWALLKLRKLPRDTLIWETGRSFTAYVPENNAA